MPDLYCQQPGCGGDGMITLLYINEKRKTFRWTSRCCPKCNHHHGDIFKVMEGEELRTDVVSESALRAEGYTDVMENLKTPVANFKKSATG